MAFSWLILVFTSVLSHVTNAFTKNDDTYDEPQIVLQGFDVVAYHLNYDDSSDTNRCKAMKGDSSIYYDLASRDEEGSYRLYRFIFTNQENRHRFECDPWRYAPRFGGFAGYGVCCEAGKDQWPWANDYLGPPVGPDPDSCGWRIHSDGHLYFFWDDIEAVNFFDGKGNLALAKKQWIQWYGDLNSGVFNMDCFTSQGYDPDQCVDLSQAYAPRIERDIESHQGKKGDDSCLDVAGFGTTPVGQGSSTTPLPETTLTTTWIPTSTKTSQVRYATTENPNPTESTQSTISTASTASTYATRSTASTYVTTQSTWYTTTSTGYQRTYATTGRRHRDPKTTPPLSTEEAKKKNPNRHTIMSLSIPVTNLRASRMAIQMEMNPLKKMARNHRQIQMKFNGRL